jgi:SAM-dependent methyltransferase
MSDVALQGQIAAAHAYEALFVPAPFGQWTTKVADAARVRSGDRVLDVACGTGVLARDIASRVGPSGSVAGLDPTPGMLPWRGNWRPGSTGAKAPPSLSPSRIGRWTPAATIATHQGTARFPSIRTMVEADVRGWLPVMGVVLDEEPITRVLEAAEETLRPYAAADGRVRFPLSAVIVAAEVQ